MHNTQRFKILALHHDPLVRAGVVTSLRQYPGLDVFEDLRDAQRTEGPIDVVVLDYHQAMSLLEARLEDGPLFGTRILALTSNDREIDVRRAIEAGIHGYVLLGGPVQELVDGVTALAHGGRRLCHAVAGRMADSFARVSLTSREVEVLQLVVKGESNKLIARQLGIELGTVKSHMSAVLAKLNASSRTQAAAIAMSRGLVGEPHTSSTEDWPPHTRSKVSRDGVNILQSSQP